MCTAAAFLCLGGGRGSWAAKSHDFATCVKMPIQHTPLPLDFSFEILLVHTCVLDENFVCFFFFFASKHKKAY